MKNNAGESFKSTKLTVAWLEKRVACRWLEDKNSNIIYNWSTLCTLPVNQFLSPVTLTFS